MLVRLNKAALADLAWWKCFLAKWSKLSIFPLPRHVVEAISQTPQGLFGCDAFSRGLGWFQVDWPQDWENANNISAKELGLVVVVAAP